MSENGLQNNRSIRGNQALLKTEKGSVQFLSLLYKVTLIRCFIKWIVRLLTGTCELQRVIQKYNGGARTIKIEECLKRSKLSLLRDMVENEPSDLDVAIAKIMVVKHIIPETNPSFSPMLKICLEQIYGYEYLYCAIEQERTEKYDSGNEKHEQMLLQLWSLLQPNEILENRVSKQWGLIGFQGDDPKTDFRGMGILSLQNLIYFAKQHTDIARQVLQHSHHPQFGYSYAIVGINITSMAYEFMSSGLLRSHFFNTVPGRPCRNDFNEVFCYLFYEFDKFWIKSEPENVMAFGRIRQEFQQTVEALLQYVPTAMLSLEDLAQ